MTLNGYRSIRHLVKRILLRAGFYRYPDFLIIGAQKAGTTFLYSVLRQHSMIVEPVNKEAHFFDYDQNFNKGTFQYHLNFDLSFKFKKGQLTFEATPDYLAHPLAAERIFRLLPNIKMVAILREPISRAYSAWKMHHFLFQNHNKYSWLYDKRTFDQVITDSLKSNADSWDIMNHLGRSLYGMQISNYLKFFKPEQLLVVFQKELEETPQQIINAITDFLTLKPLDLYTIDRTDKKFWANRSVAAIELELTENQRIALAEYFKNDKELLESILSKRIVW